MAEPRDYFEQPPLTSCTACQRQITFALNLDTGKLGPLDWRSCVYIARRELADQFGLRVLTARQFLDKVDRIILKDGSEVSPADLKFFTSHFTSCPAAAKFSGRNR